MTTKDISAWPIMKACCGTCPFKLNKEGREQNIELANIVRSRVMKASQICHHNTLKGKAETHLCRGARDFQLTVMYRLRVIEAPTDEAWTEKLNNKINNVKEL